MHASLDVRGCTTNTMKLQVKKSVSKTTVKAASTTAKAGKVQKTVSAKVATAKAGKVAKVETVKREKKVIGKNIGAKGVFAYQAGNGDKVHDGLSNAGTRATMASEYGVSVAALIGRKINVTECAALKAFFMENAKALKFVDSRVTFKSGESKQARVCVKAGIGTHAGAGKNAGKVLVFALAWAEKIGVTATKENAKFVFSKSAGGATVSGKVVSRTSDSLTVMDAKGALHYVETVSNDNNAHCFGALVS
jgi:hypothetical protein